MQKYITGFILPNWISKKPGIRPIQ